MSQGSGSGGRRSGAFLSRALLWAALFLLVLCPVCAINVSGTGGGAVRLLVLSLGFVGAFFLFLKMIFDRELRLPRGWPARLAAGFLGVGIFSTLLSDCPQTAAMTLLTWVSYASLFLLGALLGRGERGWRAARALCAVALPLAVYAILQYGVLLDELAEMIETQKEDVLARTGFAERDYGALLRRAKSKRAFGTFALPNSLAGLFLLTVPPAAALAAAARRRPTRSLLGGIVGLAVIGLFLTFSKGGWLVGCVVLLGFIAVRGRGWLRRRWKACAAVVGAAAILVGAGLGLSAGLRGRLAAMRHEFGASARVRWQYWSAAVSMWRASPVVGVGPGNFKHHYLRHKAVAAEETKHAHNDYVQLLAEAGPAAAAAYGLFWALLLAGAWRRTGRGARLPPRRDGRADGGEIGPRGVPRGLLPAAGLAGIVLAELVAAPLSISESRGLNILALAVFAALWWAGYAATGLVPPDERSRRAVRLGLTLGLFGFVLHSFLDLDLYVAGVGATAFALAGLVAAPWAGRRDVNLRAGARLAVLVVVTVLSLGVLFVVSRISAARTECRQGEIALGRAVRLAAGRASSPGDRTARLPAAARRAEVRQLLLQAEQFFGRAARINPMDFRAYRGLAECRELRLSAGATRDRFASAVAAWRDAIRLNPSVGEFHWRLGRLFADHARRFRRLIRERYAPEYEAVPADGALPSPVPALYRPAVVELARATALAPTSPRMRIRYGRVLTQAGLGAAAAEQFRAALDLNDRMVAGHAPARQRLTEEELGRVQTELGVRRYMVPTLGAE